VRQVRATGLGVLAPLAAVEAHPGNAGARVVLHLTRDYAAATAGTARQIDDHSFSWHTDPFSLCFVLVAFIPFVVNNTPLTGPLLEAPCGGVVFLGVYEEVRRLVIEVALCHGQNHAAALFETKRLLGLL
jgi:hypothetical protein